MKATAKDLRYNLKGVMELVDRGEEVLITNRGQIKARIVPVGKETGGDEPNPFVGMWKDRGDMEDVDAHIRELRRGRALC